MYLCMYVCVYSMYVCLYVCMCTYVRTRMYIYICIVTFFLSVSVTGILAELESELC